MKLFIAERTENNIAQLLDKLAQAKQEGYNYAQFYTIEDGKKAFIYEPDPIDGVIVMGKYLLTREQ